MKQKLLVARRELGHSIVVAAISQWFVVAVSLLVSGLSLSVDIWAHLIIWIYGSACQVNAELITAFVVFTV